MAFDFVLCLQCHPTPILLFKLRLVNTLELGLHTPELYPKLIQLEVQIVVHKAFMALPIVSVKAVKALRFIFRTAQCKCQAYRIPNHVRSSYAKQYAGRSLRPALPPVDLRVPPWFLPGFQGIGSCLFLWVPIAVFSSLLFLRLTIWPWISPTATGQTADHSPPER